MIEQIYFDQLLSSINNINIKIDNIINLLAALVNTITKYENGERPPFSTNIDYLISILDSI